MTLKAFKFRLEPNQQQRVLINKTLGCTRFLYNRMLDEKQTKYKSKISLNAKQKKTIK